MKYAYQIYNDKEWISGVGGFATLLKAREAGKKKKKKGQYVQVIVEDY
jgi:hypothetical protein